MIKSLIISLFFTNNLFFSQANNRCDKIKINASNISIYGEQFPIIIEDLDMLNKMYSDIRIEKKCSENYLVIECTMQNGNEYYIESLIYEYDKDSYKQEFKYTLYSNRQGHQFYGRKGDHSLLSKTMISQDTGGILVNESSNVQNIGSEVYKSYYSKLTTKYKSNVEILNLLGNPYFIKNEEIFKKENINTINDLAHYLYLTKSYKNSIYLLNKILEKSPTRTVAYLNLADSYWAVGSRELAKENYKKYVELMKSQNKDLRKIPNHALQRSQ